jgi:hypothetical protein
MTAKDSLILMRACFCSSQGILWRGIIATPLNIQLDYPVDESGWICGPNGQPVHFGIYLEATTDVRYSDQGERSVYFADQQVQPGSADVATQNACNETIFWIRPEVSLDQQNWFVSNNRFYDPSVVDVIATIFYKNLSESPDFIASYSFLEWSSNKTKALLPERVQSKYGSSHRQLLESANKLRPSAGHFFPVSVIREDKICYGVLELLERRSDDEFHCRLHLPTEFSLQVSDILRRSTAWTIEDQPFQVTKDVAKIVEIVP